MVPYDHDPADLSPIYLAIVEVRKKPLKSDWQPALRDTIDGSKVVWVRSDSSVGPKRKVVWVRDKNGERLARAK